MKKTIIFFLLLLISFNVNALEIQLDLNSETGIEPLDVNLSARILDGIRTRNCWDNNNCGTENNKPETVLACGPCTNGSTINCTTIQSCPGEKTCVGETWSACIDIPNDGCPLPTDPVILVEEIFPKQDITVTQNTLFTFQTKVTCLYADCGDVEVTLDPEITLIIEQDIDDAATCGSYFSISAFGYLGNNSGNSCSTGLKFNNISIPRESIINNARIELVSRQDHSITPVNLIIQSQTDDNPASFSNLTEFNSRTKSTAFIEWNNVPGFSALQTYTTPDLTSIIQETINQPNWNQGDSIVVFLADNESAFDALRLAIDSSDEYYGTGNEAKLIIDYSLNPTYKGGIIPMNSGNPFYTTDLNPTTCSNLLEGSSCINSWSVMPTGNIGETYKFFVDYVPVNPAITQKRTQELFVSIEAGESCSDGDGDLVNGFNPITCYSGLDCDDSNPAINSFQPELCGNGIDDNCNGETDEGCLVCVEDWECDSEWSACESGTPPYVFDWDFGDGTTATLNSPNWIVHSYSAGIYYPKVKVTDILTHSAEAIKTISVASSSGNIPPIADAGGPYNAVLGENIVLDASKSYDIDGAIDQFKWKITDKKGLTDCNPNNIVTNNPISIIACNGIGTADVNLTVRDNGAPNKEFATAFTSITINQTQTQDLINIVKMEVEPSTIKQGQDLKIIVKAENLTNKIQNFSIKFEVKENKANENISNLLNLIPNLELLNLSILPYSQGEGRKEFVLVIPSADLEAGLKGQKNYWVYATAEATGENNTLLNSRRIAFNYSGAGTKQVNVPETNFINILIILISAVIILNFKGEKKWI